MKTAREVASAIAREIGGAVRHLPDAGPDDAQFAVVTVDGRAPMMVREYRTGPLGACVPGALSHCGAAAEFDPARMASFVAATYGWLRAHPDTPSMYGVALALLDALADVGAPWAVSIPSPTDPTELWLQSATASNIGVFPDRTIVDRTYKTTTRSQLEAALPRIVDDVRASLGQIERYREAGARIDAAAAALVGRLAAGTSLPTRIERSHQRVDASTLVVQLACGDRKVRLLLDQGTREMRVHAGIAGRGDVECALDEVDARMADLRAALAAARATLTVGDLRVNARYRVLEKVGELAAGDEVTFKGLDDIDNHYGEYLFERVDGKRLVVGGDCSTPENGPLGDAHLYLARVEE